MRRTIIVIGALALAVMAWGRVGAQQEMLPKPGPGSGVTPVSQRGEWEVAINNTPNVHIANSIQLRGPVFLKKGAYAVTWPNGDTERVTIVTGVAAPQKIADASPEIGSDGWVEVQSGGRRRWININAARSIEEAR